MRWLLFLSRVAFIFGIFFLLELVRQIRDFTERDAITSSIITVAFMLGLVVVPIVNTCYLVVLFVKRKLTEYVPLWLVLSNLFFLLLLIFYIFYLNDPYYSQQ